MKTGGGLGRFLIESDSFKAICGHAIKFSILVFCLSPLPAQAQQQPIINKGDAVVTGYSGVALFKPAVGANQVDFAVINQQGASLQVFDMSQMQGRDDARLVNATRNFSVSAGKIGQVFGVAIDDDPNGTNGRKFPNIYATATSMFGLQIVKTKNGVRNRAKMGGPSRTWMDGQFGLGLGGGPGSIWKIDGRTGEVSLFANVTLNGAPNSGPALGNIAYDKRTRQLFVSDLQTGMVHAFSLDGSQVATFDHGVNGRPRLGLNAVGFDPAGTVNITSPSFNAAEPTTWGFAEQGRQVWAVAVFARRLYYSVAEGPEIWSVGIKKNGRFAGDARVEIEVQAPSGDPISDITFSGNGTMYLSQRGEAVSSYDYTVLAKSKTAAVMRYRKRKLPSGRVTWRPVPDEYAIGFPSGFRNTNGGIALGYGYDRYGFINYDSCQRMLWSTGELLRQNKDLAARLEAGGPSIVNGLQGNRVGLARPANEAPFKTYFIDFDNHYADPTYRGHVGDVAILSSCSGKVASGSPPPKKPSGPRIRIAKTCSSASFGGRMNCRITVTNSGSVAPRKAVGFTDIAKVLRGPGGGAANPLILSATVDDQAWNCSALPANNLSCSIDGAVLEPGHRKSVDVVIDISGLVGTADWRFRNCATLNGTAKKKCVWRGESDGLVVIKSGPDQVTCVAGGPCDFQLTVGNPGKRTFDGNLFFGDNLTINGAAVGGIVVDNIAPLHGCTILGAGLPLEWQCHVTIPPGGQKTFNILLTVPVGAGPAAGTVQGRNCFVATDPGLVLANNAPPANFWANMLDPANAGNMAGRSCVDFAMQAAPPNQIVPKRVINGLPKPNAWGPPILPGTRAEMKLTITAAPTFFSNPGDLITFTYVVANTGNVPIQTFEIIDNKVSPGAPIANCDRIVIAVGTSATCSANYTTVPADMNTNIITTATVSGTF